MPSAPKRHHMPAPGKRRVDLTDKLRGSARARGYSPTWDRISKHYRRRHPICEAAGCWQPSVDVHHLAPLAAGGHVLVPDEQLVALCRRHHGQAEAECLAKSKG